MTTTIEIRIDDETINAITKYYEKMRFFDLDKESGENRKVAEFLYKTLTKVNLARSKDRNTIICKMRDEGRSFSEIAKTFGISTVWASTIYHREMEKKILYEELNENDLYNCILAASVEITGNDRIGIRAYNAIRRSDLKDSIEILDRFSDNELMNIRNIGLTSVAVLRKGFRIYKERNKENA